MRLLIIADDLTGALDSAAPFASTGLRTFVALRPTDLDSAIATQADVIAVSTASREGSQNAARSAVADAMAAVAAADCMVFKKVDSRLKGHVAAEVSVVARQLDARRVVICPAIPEQGRFVRGGVVVGRGVAEPFSVSAVLGGLPMKVVAPDADNDGDLWAIVAASEPSDLLVGASGLARALAKHLADGMVSPPVRPRLVGPALIAIGSRDPITVQQVEHLRQMRELDWFGAPNGEADCQPRHTRKLTVVQMLPGKTVVAREKASADFSQTISSFLDDGVRSLLCCGGETADSILGWHGTGLIEVEGELVPGVPVGHASVNNKKLQIAAKSGGFGAVDCLLEVVESIDFAGVGRIE